MAVGLHALGVELHVVAPYRILQSFGLHVILIVGHGVACTYVNAVVVVLVACYVEVHSHTGVGCRGLVFHSGGHFVGIGSAVAHFHHGEVLVLKVDTQLCLILSVAAQYGLSQTYHVSRHGYASQQRY